VRDPDKSFTFTSNGGGAGVTGAARRRARGDACRNMAGMCSRDTSAIASVERNTTVNCAVDGRGGDVHQQCGELYNTREL
jgi:hypothetical protein